MVQYLHINLLFRIFLSNRTPNYRHVACYRLHPEISCTKVEGKKAILLQAICSRVFPTLDVTVLAIMPPTVCEENPIWHDKINTQIN